MKYVGSKNKISKELAPIIQSYITPETKGYLEPFVGGANMIDKIKHHNKIGSDIHKELIALLDFTKNKSEYLPSSITKDEYMSVRDNKDLYDDWYVGLVGFCGSYNAKYFGGYAGECNTKQGVRYYDQEAIRNLKKQSENLKDILFLNKSFLDYSEEDIVNYVIYCDIPYRNTTKYATNTFPYSEFYEWCIRMSKNNTVLVSEYNMPDEFKCVWSKECRVFLNKNNNSKQRVEKLFIVKQQ